MYIGCYRGCQVACQIFVNLTGNLRMSKSLKMATGNGNQGHSVVTISQGVQGRVPCDYSVNFNGSFPYPGEYTTTQLSIASLESIQLALYNSSKNSRYSYTVRISRLPHFKNYTPHAAQVQSSNLKSSVLQGSSVVARKPYLIQTLRLTLQFVDKICIRIGDLAEMVEWQKWWIFH